MGSGGGVGEVEAEGTEERWRRARRRRCSYRHGVLAVIGAWLEGDEVT